MAHPDQLKEWLLTLDEVQVCELLDISTEEIVNRFEDIVIAKKKHLTKEMGTTFDPYKELNFND